MKQKGRNAHCYFERISLSAEELDTSILPFLNVCFSANCLLNRMFVMDSIILKRYKQVMEFHISFLQRMGVLNVGQRIEEQAEFEKIYKNGTLSLTHSTVTACVVSFVESVALTLFSVCDL